MTDSTTPLRARDRARAEVMSELLAAARLRLESEGCAALSLRAVARDLGMASSAVYRYVPSRDALLTLLIIEAYDAVGEVAEKAVGRGGRIRPRADVARGRARGPALGPRPAVLVRAHLRHPGARLPRPGRHRPRAPSDCGESSSGCVLRAAADGVLAPAGPDFDPAGRMAPEALATAGCDDPDTVPTEVARIAVRSATLFTSLVGAISVELFGHLHHVAADHARFFDVTIATSAAGVGLRITLD